jgi:precorrin-8X/cobalt-precorrin-8 methylmutase
MIAGGLAYTIGFPVLVRRRPDPWPKTFGYHEVWHLLVVVDWSANSAPKRGRDSIWIAVRDSSGVILSNPSTRFEAEAILADLLAADARTLVGVDFSLGFPVGTAGSLGLDGPSWASMGAELGRLVEDDARNCNNRFQVASTLNARMGGAAGPFWGCPPKAASASLTTTKPPPGPLAEWRTVESALRGQGHRPFSSWQLLGAGTVGSQSLLGIPMMMRLRERFGGRLAVWPFEPIDRAIVVAEVWPSLLPLDPTVASIRDAAQVLGVAEWLVGLDLAGGLDDLFCLDNLAPEVHDVVAGEEGWVLGVRP